MKQDFILIMWLLLYSYSDKENELYLMGLLNSMESPDQLSGLAELSAGIFLLFSMGTVLIKLLQLVSNAHDPLKFFYGR